MENTFCVVYQTVLTQLLATNISKTTILKESFLDHIKISDTKGTFGKITLVNPSNTSVPGHRSSLPIASNFVERV